MEQEKAIIWWESLSTEIKDSINKSIFNKKILDIEKAYKKLGKVIY